MFALIATHTQTLDTNAGIHSNQTQVEIDQAQEKQIRQVIYDWTFQGRLPSLIVGDFNVGRNYIDENYRLMTDHYRFKDAYNGAEASWDPANPEVKFGLFPQEHACVIDHIFSRQGKDGMHWKVAGSKLVFKERFSHLRLSGVPTTLSDHYGVKARMLLLK